MCFKNLPIEFDESGKMTLRDDAASAFGLTGRPHNVGPKPLSEAQIETLADGQQYVIPLASPRTATATPRPLATAPATATQATTAASVAAASAASTPATAPTAPASPG